VEFGATQPATDPPSFARRPGQTKRRVQLLHAKAWS
jgi:hypothetical protein